MGVTRKTLSLLLNEHQGVSAEMALRLSKALGTLREFWMGLQWDYDLWQAEKNVQPEKIKPFRKMKGKPAGASTSKTKITRQSRIAAHTR